MIAGHSIMIHGENFSTGSHYLTLSEVLILHNKVTEVIILRSPSHNIITSGRSAIGVNIFFYKGFHNLLTFYFTTVYGTRVARTLVFHKHMLIFFFAEN